MQDEEIIRKVRLEHERLRDITKALEDSLRSDAGDDLEGWLAEVCKSFEHFRAHLIHRIALEEIGGFLDIVVERRPTLSKQVEHLREGHAKMIEMAGETLSGLRCLSCTCKDARQQAGIYVQIMLSEVNYHEESENLLVASVFTDDLGVGD